ncbi:MAG: acetylesterase [Actinomycetota bacterium]
MAEHYSHLGVYSDWVAATPSTDRLSPPAFDEVRRVVRQVFAVPAAASRRDAEHPLEVRVDDRWTAGGIDGEEISYSVGFGPRTSAWLLKPAGVDRPLPAVLALHGHDAFKFYGKEKIADGPQPPVPVVAALRSAMYGGLAFANELARRGFVVLVPDVFGWGSRRFPLAEMPPLLQRLAAATTDITPPDRVPGTVPADIAEYNSAAWHHESVIEKYCSLLGTTLAAVVAREDRIALDYLLDRPDTTDRAGSIGLSGGGCRSALLRATSERVTASVVVGMMTTYAALLDHNVVDHTWMLMPAGFARFADWPDLAASAAPAPLLVQYNRHDPLFTLAGAEAAHERISSWYAASADPAAYTGQFFDGLHKFDSPMQALAFDWLSRHLQ